MIKRQVVSEAYHQFTYLEAAPDLSGAARTKLCIPYDRHGVNQASCGVMQIQ